MPSPRRLTVSVSFYGVDHERWAKNETTQGTVVREAVLDTTLPQTVLVWANRWGGECRAELNVTAQLLDDGNIRLEAHGKLFEGESEDTSELAGEGHLPLLVPRGRTAYGDLTARNLEPDGGDIAEWKFTASNILIED